MLEADSAGKLKFDQMYINRQDFIVRTNKPFKIGPSN